VILLDETGSQHGRRSSKAVGERLDEAAGEQRVPVEWAVVERHLVIERRPPRGGR